MNTSTQESLPVTQVATTDLKELAVDVVRQAMQGGATAAEAVAVDGSEFSTTVRLGNVETLKESGSKGIGVRVFIGQLRKKLEPDPPNPRYFLTEPGMGYRFNPRGAANP